MQLSNRLFSPAIVLLGAVAGCAPTPDEKPRHIILIQLDDLGYDDLACHGNPFVETPNIDRLYSQSLRFDRFYVNPVCSASRASLLTGRFFLRTGVSHVHGGKDFINKDERLLPQMLKSADYTTGMWGKWHSGDADGYWPWQRGFDEAFQSKLYKHQNAEGLLNGVPVNTNRWSDELLTTQAIDFLEKNRNKPSFQYLSYLTCHSPLNAPDSLIAKYQGKGLSPTLSTIYAMIDQFDTQLGRLLEYLNREGLDENTMILFMSDNGPAYEGGKLTAEDRKIRYISGMQGHKGDIYENGVRSPLFIRWTGKITPGNSNQLCDITDIYPTLAEVTGASVKEQKPLDGISLWPHIIEGKTLNKTVYNYAHKAWLPSDSWSPIGQFNEYDPVTESQKKQLTPEQQVISVIEGNYKLMYNPGSNTTRKDTLSQVLIDIVKDPGEQLNLIGTAENKDLKQKLNNWFDDIKREPSSFGSPVFIIRDGVSILPAKGASEISGGLVKTYNTLTGWKKGSRFIIRAEVHSKGNYSVKLVFDKVAANRMQIEVNGKSYLSVRSDSSNIYFNEITLCEGIQELIISVPETESNLNPASNLKTLIVTHNLKP